MQLKIQEGELMLPNDFSFEIERNNPFFSNEGMATVPVTLPATNEMKAKLGFPDRINRAYRFLKKKPAILKHQMFSKRCSLVIDSYDNESGITASLAFEESRMYAELQDKSIKDIFDNEVYAFQGATSAADISLKLYERYSDPLSQTFSDFVAFPVAMEKQDDGSVFIANDIDTSSSRDRNFIYSPRIISIGSKTEEVPDGYGVIPFITLKHFLYKTFSLCGYTVVRNDLADVPFDTLVLLNNCADALCGQSAIKYRDVVPSITFGELLEWLKAKFCAAVYINNKNVSIVLFEKMASETPDMDLTGYVQDGMSITYPDAKSVSLAQGTSIDGAEPAFEEIDKMKSTICFDKYEELEVGVYPYGVFDMYLTAPTGYFYKESGEAMELVGSNCIPYHHSDKLPEESFEACDEFVPQHLITKGRLPYGETHIPYIGERLHNHTVIKTEKGGNGEEEKQDLMLCHCFAGVNKLCGNSQPFDTASNRPVSYNTGGRFQWVGRQYPTLTPYGLYPYCWAKYNELLMNSSPILRVRLNLPTSMIFSLDMSKPKLLNGRKVMVVSYTIEMSDASIKVVSANLQQIPAYKDAITDKSIGYVPEGYRLGWELVQSWPGPNSGFTYNKTPYTQADAPVYHPLFEGQVAKYRMITEDPIISRWCDINEYFKGVLIPI